MKVRSQQISEKLDHEAQCGFRIERGTIDGVWNIRMLVDKRRDLSAWAYQEDGRSWGRPMKRWAESFEEDLKGASIPVSKWHKLAQDKENWKDLISEIGEESKKGKAKKKRKVRRNPLASCMAGCAGK